MRRLEKIIFYVTAVIAQKAKIFVRLIQISIHMVCIKESQQVYYESRNQKEVYNA
jgi:hypothetical protein